MGKERKREREKQKERWGKRGTQNIERERGEKEKGERGGSTQKKK